jgi:hypothetical protein
MLIFTKVYEMPQNSGQNNHFYNTIYFILIIIAKNPKIGLVTVIRHG